MSFILEIKPVAVKLFSEFEAYPFFSELNKDLKFDFSSSNILLSSGVSLVFSNRDKMLSICVLSVWFFLLKKEIKKKN